MKKPTTCWKAEGGTFLKVLVTGGSGFIGSHVAERFTKQGNEVVVFDNLSRNLLLKATITRSLQHNWDYIKNRCPNVKMMNGDVTNLEQLKEASEGVEAIIHTAAQVAVTTSLLNPKVDFEINALGTLNVLEVARLLDAQVIFTSTNKVYGGNVNEIPVGEKRKRYTFADPKYKQGIPEDFSIDHCGHSPYGASKLSGDIYVQDYAHSYGLNTKIFRMSCIYGPRQFGVEDQGWVAWFTIATALGKPLIIYGDGKQVRDVLYIDDLITAFAIALDKSSRLKGEVFNIGGGPKNILSLLELLDLLEQLSGKRSKLRFEDWRPSDQKVYITKINKAKEKLGWKPAVTPRQGVQKLLTWVTENRQLFC